MCVLVRACSLMLRLSRAKSTQICRHTYLALSLFRYPSLCMSLSLCISPVLVRVVRAANSATREGDQEEVITIIKFMDYSMPFLGSPAFARSCGERERVVGVAHTPLLIHLHHPGHNTGRFACVRAHLPAALLGVFAKANWLMGGHTPADTHTNAHIQTRPCPFGMVVKQLFNG